VNIYSVIIAENLSFKENQVKDTLELLDEGATIPFISRYRKEATGSLDELQIAEIQHEHKRLKAAWMNFKLLKFSMNIKDLRSLMNEGKQL